MSDWEQVLGSRKADVTWNPGFVRVRRSYASTYLETSNGSRSAAGVEGVFGGFVRKESCVEYVDRVYGRGKECVGKERQCPP